MAETMTQARPSAGQEMKDIVQLLNGRWEMTVTYHRNEMSTQSGTFSGQELNRPGPGGLSVIVESKSAGPAGPFEGIGVIHWSPEGRAYRLYWFTNASAVPATFTGRWEGRDLVFSGTEIMMGKKLASRHIITSVKPDSFDYIIEMGSTPTDLKTFITIGYTRARP